MAPTAAVGRTASARTCVAFLRAINVTGRFVKMDVLVAAFHALGHTDARTYIASGNVIFTSPPRSLAALPQRLEDGLAPLLGFRAEAFVRTAAEVHAIAAHAAALGERLPDGGEVNVCFVASALGTEQAAALDRLRTRLDDFDIHEREIYWLCRQSQSASRFSNAVLERRLGLRSTLRRARMLAGLAREL